MKMFVRCAMMLGILVSLGACSRTASQNPAQSSGGYSAYIQNKGSDTIVNMALAWAEAYREIEPSVSISVTGGGSGTGITSLINGTADLANASRRIKAEEIEEAQKNGVEPNEVVVARDAIAVIVNRNNPVDELTLQQISDIYSGKINNWKEVGGEDRPIVRLSRETNSGTHVYFLEEVLRLGQESDLLFDPRTLLLPSSEGIMAEVLDNPNAIGYDGLGYVTGEVKTIAVAKEATSGHVMPSVESVNSGLYPISRDLYVYTNGVPTGALAAYLNWILSDQAQGIVLSLGFVPVKQ